MRLDWIDDSILERSRRLREAKDVYASSASANGHITLPWLISQVRKLLTTSQSWFVVSIVGELISLRRSSGVNANASVYSDDIFPCPCPCAGAGIGLNAAIISIITEWLSDIKMGYCSDGWWLNQQFCCWELDGDEDSGCDSWHLWSTVSVARWFIYVLFAVRRYFFPSSLPTLPRPSDEYGLTKSTKRPRCLLSRLVLFNL